MPVYASCDTGTVIVYRPLAQDLWVCSSKKRMTLWVSSLGNDRPVVETENAYLSWLTSHHADQMIKKLPGST